MARLSQTKRPAEKRCQDTASGLRCSAVVLHTRPVEDRSLERRLSIGREDAEGIATMLAKRVGPQVFLIDSTLVHRLSQDAVELRDRKPLRVDRDGIDRMEHRRGPVLIFAAEKDRHRAFGIYKIPLGSRQKSWKLNALLTDIESLEAIDFATAQGGEPP